SDYTMVSAANSGRPGNSRIRAKFIDIPTNMSPVSVAATPPPGVRPIPRCRKRTRTRPGNINGQDSKGSGSAAFGAVPASVRHHPLQEIVVYIAKIDGLARLAVRCPSTRWSGNDRNAVAFQEVDGALDVAIPAKANVTAAHGRMFGDELDAIPLLMDAQY